MSWSTGDTRSRSTRATSTELHREVGQVGVLVTKQVSDEFRADLNPSVSHTRHREPSSRASSSQPNASSWLAVAEFHWIPHPLVIVLAGVRNGHDSPVGPDSL